MTIKELTVTEWRILNCWISLPPTEQDYVILHMKKLLRKQNHTALNILKASRVQGAGKRKVLFHK